MKEHTKKVILRWKGFYIGLPAIVLFPFLPDYLVDHGYHELSKYLIVTFIVLIVYGLLDFQGIGPIGRMTKRLVLELDEEERQKYKQSTPWE